MVYSTTQISSPMEWDPSMLCEAEVSQIEKSWQRAAVGLTHISLATTGLDDSWLKALVNGEDMVDEDDDDEEEDIVTLSRMTRETFPSFYADRNDVVQEAVRQDPRAIMWASPRLRHDRHFVLTLARHSPGVLPYLPSWHWQQRDNDKENDFVLEVVRANPRAISYLVPPSLSYQKNDTLPNIRCQQGTFWDDDDDDMYTTETGSSGSDASSSVDEKLPSPTFQQMLKHKPPRLLEWEGNVIQTQPQKSDIPKFVVFEDHTEGVSNDSLHDEAPAASLRGRAESEPYQNLERYYKNLMMNATAAGKVNSEPHKKQQYRLHRRRCSETSSRLLSSSPAFATLHHSPHYRQVLNHTARPNRGQARILQ